MKNNSFLFFIIVFEFNTKRIKDSSRIVFFTILLSICNLNLQAQQFEFIGIFSKPETGKSFYCLDQDMIQTGMNNRSSYDSLRNEFYKNYKGKSPSTFLLTPDKAAIIYEYETYSMGFDCQYRVVGIKQGTNIGTLKQELENDVNNKPSIYKTKPQIFLTWEGKSSYKEIIEKNYEDLAIKYTIGSFTSGNTVVILQGKNSSTSKSVLVKLNSPQDNLNETILIEPGGSFTRKINSISGFEIDVQYVEVSEKPLNLIDESKSFIKDLLQINDGKLKIITDGAAGKRG